MSKPYNLYKEGFRLIAKRLLWDLSWNTRRRHKAKLDNIKNVYNGNKAVIICNGPSLNKVDFKLLENVYTFGLNKIDLLFDRMQFRPNAIVCVNNLVMEQNYSIYRDTDIPLYLKGRKAQKLKLDKLDHITLLHTGGYGFAQDCCMTVPEGFTVTYVAIQLAFHMGFSEVALVGCDHYFSKSEGSAGETVTMEGADENHFDPRYFMNKTWQLPDILESEISYLRAKKVFQEHNRTLVNCTDGGALELLPRLKLEDFVS